VTPSALLAAYAADLSVEELAWIAGVDVDELHAV
jgi:hypothetical protein